MQPASFSTVLWHSFRQSILKPFSSSPGILTTLPCLPLFPNFHQYVNCCTRDNKTLDLLYANTAGLQLINPSPRWAAQITTWSICALFTHLWCSVGHTKQDIDSLTDCITDYINFCVETTVPTKRVRCFSNNKPWVTPDLRALLQEKRRAFQSGNRDELRRVQRDLKRKIQRVQGQLQEENGGPPAAKQREGGLERAPSYLRTGFDTGPTSTPLSLSTDQPTSSSLCLHCPLTIHQHLHHLWGSHHPPPSPPSLQCSSPPPPPSPNLFTPTVDQVRTQLKKIKARKATGPDGISSRLLRDCADQLCQVVCYIFNLSLSLERVPVLWKTSCVVPVPKTSRPKEPNHFRPVALTSHLMKALERIVLRHLRPLVSPNMDPLQFAYQPGIGVDDAVIYLLQRSLSHLEDAGNTDCVSDVVVCSTGAPQGTVLSPFLFTLYTSDFTYSTDSCHLQKFSDDTAIVGCVSEGNDCEYRKVIMDFVDWCELNHLQVNASKTKEMVIDFSRKPSSDIAPVNIQGLDIERVRTYKGVRVVCYMLRRLGSFGVCRPLLRTFYETVVASVVSYAVVCWGGGCSERDKKRLNRLIKRASSVCGCPLDSIEVMGERRALAKLSTIIDNTSHPLHQTVGALSSSFSKVERDPSSVALPQVSSFCHKGFFEVFPEGLRTEGVTTVQIVKPPRCVVSLWFMSQSLGEGKQMILESIWVMP
ncbi:hypothetical protein L3Q82_011589, partial [Scortum barcoo]